MVVLYENPQLRDFRRTNQDLTVEQFKKIDKEILAIDQKEIAYSIRNTLYDLVNNGILNGKRYYDDYILRHELSVLIHEANKKRAIKPIRVMFNTIPNLLYRIKPCLLMSPLSVATYLSYSPNAFDVVIFDEASQIFPWDAIGAISRSKTTIVVGDSKQMPPTNFFMSGSGLDDEYDEEAEETANDYESILDLCSAVLPQKMLNWHYRSKTESLIAFSNRNFYHNKLVTFPSSRSDTDDFGISFHYVENGVFANRQNIKEAEAVADLVYENFKKHPERSLGVVCFSINQQALLEDLMDERRRKNDQFSKYFDQNVKEPFFIKNLETVQGDERDTIIFSIGYGKDAAGNLKHNFGPLNRKGGERRLNVAITRAKYNVQVVSSIRSFDIDLNRTHAEGAKLLRDYLDLAENGITVLNKDLFADPNAEADSAFEESVANVIREAGFKVDLQVGCSGYRIDICVKHPKNNDYVLAVECDGKTYHSSRNARDRDRLRQEVLERLGWTFYRIWSTDWFINYIDEKKNLIARIEKAIVDYDIKAKEVEERNKVLVEERYKETFDNVQVSNKPSQIIENKKEEQGGFFDLLDDKEIEYIKTINKELEKAPYKFIFEEREFIFAYKLAADLERGKKKAWFWIVKTGKGFNLKMKVDPNDVLPSQFLQFSINANPSSVVTYILNACKKRNIRVAANVSDPQKVNRFNDEGDNDEQQQLKNERFFFLIARAIQGRKVYCRNFEESGVINEVLDFTMKEICKDGVSKKAFKNKEDFDQNKYSRHFTYTLFGTSFSLGNISIAKAEEIFYFFIAYKVAETIRQYEKIFKKDIISDFLLFMNSMESIIRTSGQIYSRAEGLTSSFVLVPDTVIDNVIEKYIKFIK